MAKLDRYLLSDFLQSFLATLIVLLVVSVGGVLVDILGRIADGRMPAGLLLSQLGLQFVVYLPIIVPLALMLGLALAIARLYRDSEMAVLTGVGVGPRRLLKPILLLVAPVVALVALCSVWLGPWADRTSEQMIEDASRSVVVAGLEPGKFTQVSGGGIIYLSSLNEDGTRMGKVFMQRTRDGRIDVVSAKQGSMFFEGERQRFLRLEDGYRVEGPENGALDYRLMRYASNEIALPDRDETRDKDDPEMMTTGQLLADPRPEAKAQLHWRITPPLLALAFALLTLPLARSAPRQQRYGRIMMAFLAYMVGVQLSILGRQWLAKGDIPAGLGMWWLTVPLLALALWLYFRDGRLGRPRAGATA
ncbi:LPS export ABC transporter permease LptF [Stenotrophomonas sp. ATCM1_4]|uniref:LPS export ABC transporter permease LptF n=1 Tax=Stenotrophomonas sp. ATCM1_4 TaxID=2259330 RepID=UPI001052F4B6|nr:LPS export ABC transporter permease LptF [Stenotrophomonas sp. ATCM1_4]TDB28614.1 LPS export ABC transporter permease LptF [Stenotrophomonas sp. ATCM1_4]